MEALQYAGSGDHHLAFRDLGGPDDRDVVLITPGGTIPMDFLGRDRIGARLLAGLGVIGRLVIFDRRGIGLSDPITNWDQALVEQWAEDLWAIVDATCTRPPVVVSLGDFWGPARLFAAAHPDALSALVLYEPHGPEESIDLRASVSDVDRVATSGPFDDGDWISRVCPSRGDDGAFREWWDIAGRSGASPAVAERLYDRPPELCVRRLVEAHRRIEVPTLVLRRPANRMGSPGVPDPVADEIPGGRRVELSGQDYHWLGEEIDELLAEISGFVLGEARLPAPSRELRAVLFTDLVGSTERVATVGDARWRAVLDRHDHAVGEEIARHGGIVVKSTGDGVLATLPSGDAALRAARGILRRLAADDLEVRIGIHVGDVERRGGDVAGLAVHIAARVMALAAGGEVLVTSAVVDAVAGSDDSFEVVAPEQHLRGVPGTWTVHRRLEPNGPRPRPEPSA